MNIDIPALFADYAGIQQPDFIQGKSFRKYLQWKETPDWRNSIYYRYWEHHPDRPAHFGIRTQQYKLIFYYGQPLGMKGASSVTTEPAWEFYDMRKDPIELRNLINYQAYQKTIEAMKIELLQQKNLTGDKDD